LLIGPKGTTQKALERRSGARVIIKGNSNDFTEESRFIEIEGTDEAVEKAREEIEGYFTDDEKVAKLRDEQRSSMVAFNMGVPSHYGGGGGGGGGNMATKQVFVPNQHTGFVIGRGGENIKAINSLYQVHVQVKKKRW